MIETGETTSEDVRLICRCCGQTVELNSKDTIPTCPRCNNTTFDK